MTSEPTDFQISRAAHKWCYDKAKAMDRSVFLGDVEYFRNNWRHLNGLKTYVEREMAEAKAVLEMRLNY